VSLATGTACSNAILPQQKVKITPHCITLTSIASPDRQKEIAGPTGDFVEFLAQNLAFEGDVNVQARSILHRNAPFGVRPEEAISAARTFAQRLTLLLDA
jgi:hypothetical protein